MSASQHSQTDPAEEHAEIADILRRHWRTAVEIRRLPGENLNLDVRFDDGSIAVLKITLEEEAPLDLEEAAIDVLDAADFPVPTTIPDRRDQVVVEVSIGDAPARARLQRRLDGDPWRDADVSTRLGEDIGRTLAAMHHALGDLRHPAASRTHRWDVARATLHRPAIDGIDDADRRRAVESILHEHAAIVLPRLPSCPRGVLHGDPNDENLLVEGDRVVGIVDFGDVLEGALVQDLAITLAYAMQVEGGRGFEVAAAILRGYESIRALEAAEREVLFPLVRSRLATSALIAVGRRRVDPGHATWFSHGDTTWRAIDALAPLSPRDGAVRLGLAEDVPPSIDRTLERRRRITGSNLSISYDHPLHIVAGDGAYLFAEDGRPYLDLVNNVCHVGHCHPRVVDAIATQAGRLNTNTRYLSSMFVEYAERLASRFPDPIDTVFLVNSGSEANELALRLARAATWSRDVLVIDGAYHGNTGNCVAMSPYKFDGPGGSGRAEWVHVVPSPDRYRGPIRGDGDDVGSAYALELATVIGEASAAGRSIGAFFAEPILSCGGQIPLPPGYLGKAFEHVRKAGGVCVADEVQVGFGRVGDAFWGFELDGVDGEDPVVPDIVVMGKPIGNGHPMGAIATTREIADDFANGMEFFSTFGGNPVSCAAGNAVLDVIEEEGLQNRAAVLGHRFLDGLRGLADRHEVVGDVRGRGLFLGIEFVHDRSTLVPAADVASYVVQRMRERGVLLSTDGPLHNVVKIKPPMTLGEEDVDMALRLLDEVLDHLPGDLSVR